MTVAGAVVTAICVIECGCAGWYAPPLLVLPGLCALVSWLILSPPGGENEPPKTRVTIFALRRGIVVSMALGLPWTLYAMSTCSPEHVETCLLD